MENKQLQCRSLLTTLNHTFDELIGYIQEEDIKKWVDMYDAYDLIQARLRQVKSEMDERLREDKKAYYTSSNTYLTVKEDVLTIVNNEDVFDYLGISLEQRQLFTKDPFKYATVRDAIGKEYVTTKEKGFKVGITRESQKKYIKKTK